MYTHVYTSVGCCVCLETRTGEQVYSLELSAIFHWKWLFQWTLARTSNPQESSCLRCPQNWSCGCRAPHQTLFPTPVFLHGCFLHGSLSPHAWVHCTLPLQAVFSVLLSAFLLYYFLVNYARNIDEHTRGYPQCQNSSNQINSRAPSFLVSVSLQALLIAPSRVSSCQSQFP